MSTAIDSLGSRVLAGLRSRFADSWCDLPISQEFRARSNETLKVPVRLAFTRARVAPGAEVRLTTIEGPGTELFALMVFPDDAERVPIFAAEYVVFGKRIRAAVVDLQPAGMGEEWLARSLRRLESLGEANPDLLAQGEMPEWCRDYFTPGAVFAMGLDVEELPRLERVLMDYLGAWCDLATVGKELRPAAIAEYKAHHVTHTPGRPYLERMFGEEWTREFLLNAMYG